MAVRGIRGAVSIEHNTKEEILAGTAALMKALMEKNRLRSEDMVSVIFSVTEDLNAAFPAAAARAAGLDQVPLFDCMEIPVPGSLPGIVRVLIHVNTEKTQQDMIHIYMGRASSLRPDLSEK